MTLEADLDDSILPAAVMGDNFGRVRSDALHRQDYATYAGLCDDLGIIAENQDAYNLGRDILRQGGYQRRDDGVYSRIVSHMPMIVNSIITLPVDTQKPIAPQSGSSRKSRRNCSDAGRLADWERERE